MAKRKRKRDRQPIDPEDREQDLLFQEVTEDLKQEQLAALWKKYGTYAVTAVVVAVAAVAGWRYWQSRELAARETWGERFAVAASLAQNGKTKEAADTFGLIAKDGTRGYAILARFREAALLAERGDRAAAARLYRAVADNDGVDDALRNLAVILWALNSLDTADPARAADRLKPLTAAQSPWRFSALELSALFARRAGKHGEARKIFERLAKDGAAPSSVRARAREMLSILGKS